MAFGKSADSHAQDLVPLQEAGLHYLQGRVVGPERLGALAAGQQPEVDSRLAGEAAEEVIELRSTFQMTCDNMRNGE